jgi:hypothetical protein
MPKARAPLERIIYPDVPVTIDVKGKPETFRLCWDYTAIANLEDKTGSDCLENFVAPWVKVNIGKLGAMFWAASLYYQPEYAGDEGLATLRSFLNYDNSLDVFNALWKAYLLYLPKDKAAFLSGERERIENEQREELESQRSGKTPDPQKPVGDNEPTGENSGTSADTNLASASASSGN